MTILKEDYICTCVLSNGREVDIGYHPAAYTYYISYAKDKDGGDGEDVTVERIGAFEVDWERYVLSTFPGASIVKKYKKT